MTHPSPEQGEALKLIEELRHDFINIVVGGCTCGTKPPDPALHELGCHYRMAETGLARIEKWRITQRPPAAEPSTNASSSQDTADRSAPAETLVDRQQRSPAAEPGAGQRGLTRPLPAPPDSSVGK